MITVHKLYNGITDYQRHKIDGLQFVISVIKSYLYLYDELQNGRTQNNYASSRKQHHIEYISRNSSVTLQIQYQI